MFINKQAKFTSYTVIICVVSFIIINMISPELMHYVCYDNSNKLNVWTYITSMFMHGSLIHLLFNMITFFGFGQQMEIFLGRKDFIKLYFISGVCSILTWIAFNFTSGGLLVGASGAICGVIAAFAVVYPNRKVLLFFIIPIKVKNLMLALVPISIVLWFFKVGMIAHMAHVGGALGGYLFMKWHRKKSLKGRKRPTDDKKFFSSY